VEVKEKKVLSAASDQAGKARLIAAAAPHSGAFLHARPCSSLATRLDDSSLRIAIALRLGAQSVHHDAPVCVAQLLTALEDMNLAAASLLVGIRDTAASMT